MKTVPLFYRLESQSLFQPSQSLGDLINQADLRLHRQQTHQAHQAFRLLNDIVSQTWLQFRTDRARLY